MLTKSHLGLLSVDVDVRSAVAVEAVLVFALVSAGIIECCVSQLAVSQMFMGVVCLTVNIKERALAALDKGESSEN